MSRGRILRFSDILGQERAKRALQYPILSGRLPHAYLFSGIAGVGKTSMGMVLAASLNCKSKNGLDACGTCSACRQLISGNFPDFLIIRPDGDSIKSIKIKHIRELQESMRFAPLAGGYRVVIIDQAETMTEEAANAFLKTLEEPPKANLLILNAIEPDNLLPTIVSRCQKITFAPLAAELIVEYLVREIGIQGKSATVLAKLSQGSLGKAIAMAESDFLERREKWLKCAMEIPQMDLDELFDVALQLSNERAPLNSKDSKYDIGGLFDLLGVLATWYRDLLLLKRNGREDLIINADHYAELKNFAKKFTLLAIYESLLVLDQAQKDIRARYNKALVFQKTMLRLRELAEESQGAGK